MINLAQKVGQEFVNSVFKNVHTKYDRANDAMSFFMHRKWKKDFVSMLNIHKVDKVLDVACGSGDITKLILEKTPNVIGCDISEEMLSIAKKKIPECVFQVEDAQQFSFDGASFDFITCVFGLRNFQEIEKSIVEMVRILKPNGTIAIMDFMPNADGYLFNKAYHSYIKYIIPKFDTIFKNDANSYEYFSQSIINFQSRDELKKILEKQNLHVITPSLCSGAVGIFLCKKA